MATQETQLLDDIIVKSRRKMMALSATSLAGVLLGTASTKASAATTYSDSDILNFALNLEYLEANFYYLAAFGTTIDKPNQASIAAGGPSTGYALTGINSGSNSASGNPVIVKPSGVASCKVPFTSDATGIAIGSYATETAIEEGKHVNFLYNALKGSSLQVAQPSLDLYNSFIALGNAVNVANFDPFSSQTFFLIGAYIFEDVGVTAYHGAASLITTPANLTAAAGILAVEAYHAGLVRTTINVLDPTDVAFGTSGLLTLTKNISNVRAGAALAAASTNTFNNPYDGTATSPDDFGLVNKTVTVSGITSTATQIVDADPTTVIAFARSTTQILNIVTVGKAFANGAAVSPAVGGFFPNGMNGLFR